MLLQYYSLLLRPCHTSTHSFWKPSWLIWSRLPFSSSKTTMICESNLTRSWSRFHPAVDSCSLYVVRQFLFYSSQPICTVLSGAWSHFHVGVLFSLSSLVGNLEVWPIWKLWRDEVRSLLGPSLAVWLHLSEPQLLPLRMGMMLIIVITE